MSPRPSAPANRRQSRSFAPAMNTHCSSRQRKFRYGDSDGWAEPRALGMVPASRKPSAWKFSSPSAVSSSEPSTRWPRPVRSRQNSAFTTPYAVMIPVERSRNDTPARTGAPPGSPVIDMIPLKACMSAS